MAITDVRTKINTILSEGKRKGKRPMDPHKKTRQGAPEATVTDAGACCESEVFEEVTASTLSPMANQVLDILRQQMEQGQFQSLSQEIIQQIKASMPDKEGEIDTAFKELEANGLISISDGGISAGQAPEPHVLRDCTVEAVQAEADRILREFSFLGGRKKSLEGQTVNVGGETGEVIVDQGDGELYVRFHNGTSEWVQAASAEVGLETATYIAPVAQMQTLIDTLSAPGSKFADRRSGWQWSISQYGNKNVAQCDVTAPKSFHKQLSSLFLSKAELRGMRESVELTAAGIKLAVESLTIIKK